MDKAINEFAATWADIEITILSEVRQRQILYDITYMWNLKKKDTNELIYKMVRRSNQSILKEISPGYSLEGLMLKLELHYFGHLMRRVDSLEKSLLLGGIGRRRRRG